ncbi:MAG: hypothetical protein J6V97_02935 [Prevotella sp.]|nr:hypothetical protein [Prevotella sp.]
MPLLLQKYKTRLLTPLVVLACLLTSCTKELLPLDEQNAVYYWRTELRLNDAERQFLSDHHIRKVYCRYFDVVMDEVQATPRPNATLAFNDTLPVGVEMVPTVYITEDCMHERHDSLAVLVVRRVLQMNETNGIRGVREIQIDCDYTSRSRPVFYNFLKAVKAELASHPSPHTSHPLSLSATIRLHQLQMEAPPVDYGVLMLYNTGDPRRYDERNPILDERDVQPYAQYLADYPLPLAAAYPVYRWQRQVEGVRIEHTVDKDVILNVKSLVERKRPELSRAIITYHLDEENINRYDKQTYEAIYRHH